MTLKKTIIFIDDIAGFLDVAYQLLDKLSVDI